MNMKTRITGSGRRAPRLIGEPGAWIFVAGDLTVFGLIFLTYESYYTREPEAFRQASGTLSFTLGLVNTLLLLTGSWFVAVAVDDFRQGRIGGAHRRIAAGIACGSMFVAVKAVEWSARFAAGDTPMASDYFMFYFMLTGIHLMHVLVGLGILGFLFRLTRRQVPDAAEIRAMEVGGVFWHLVDLLWIVMFALLYLVRSP